MARKDERGVIIPAPLQGSDAVISGKRYGDKHRGPAVANAYELSHCWIDLRERSLHWPAPDEMPPQMIELAKVIPEGQRAVWLRDLAHSEEIIRLISHAIRCGDLPIWVAPIGESERLVATGALATIDKRSIQGGVFCPISEAHKAESDKPWLWERPLFVKWDDWVRFVAAIQRSKGLGGSLTTERESKLDQEVAEFDQAKPDWLELWKGPLHFRATYDKGRFGPGHSLERINQYGRDGATGGGRHAPIYAVRLDPEDGALVIEWLIGLAGREPPFQSIRYYHGGLGRGLYNRLRDDPQIRDQQLAHIPANERKRALGAYACAITIREWAEREFFQAVHAGHCEIWARVGSKVAPFRRVPADIFRAYEIQEWGYGVPGGAWAKLDGAEPLYSIHVCASERYKAILQAEQTSARMTYEDAVNWCRDWQADGRGSGMDKAWSAFKLLPNAKGCARDTFFRPAWTDAKTKSSG